jgi:hypothetical protein
MRPPVSIGEIHFHIESRYQKSIDRNTLWHVLRRDPRIESCNGVPMETPRLDVTTEATLAFFQAAMQVTDGVPAHFVFNMDEMGHQDRADPTEKTCLVPAYHPTKQVHIPVSRTGKRITQMAPIAADGSVWKPEILIPRKTVDTDLLLTGLTSEKVTVRSQPRGFVAAALVDA